MVFLKGIAWLIIPNTDWGYDTNNSDEFEYNSWRIFVAASALPAFLVAIGLFWFPESPKFLLSKGREYQALKVFAWVYHVNTGMPASSYPVSKHD